MCKQFNSFIYTTSIYCCHLVQLTAVASLCIQRNSFSRQSIQEAPKAIGYWLAGAPAVYIVVLQLVLLICDVYGTTRHT